MNPKKVKISSTKTTLFVLVLLSAFLLAFFHGEIGREGEQRVMNSEKDQKADDIRKQNFCDKHLYGNRVHDITKILSLFKKPVTLLDVGTNVGVVSLTALYCMNVSHSTLSVEPVPMNARRFMTDVRLMGNALHEKRIAFRELAFSNANTQTEIYVPLKRGDNAAFSKDASIANIGEQPVEGVVVELSKGDKVINDMVKQLKHQRYPQIVKIDTQGNEPRVVEGMKNFLTKHRDEGLMVFAENDKRLLRKSGFSVFSVYDFMKGLGYKVYCKPKISVSEDGFGDLRVSGEQWKREYMKSKTCADLIYWAGKEESHPN